MASGTIVTLQSDRGFGFIRDHASPPSADQLFFHHSAVDGDGFGALQEGDTVTFEVTVDPHNAQRQRAIHVSTGELRDIL